MPATITTTPESVEKQIHDLRELVSTQKAKNEELEKRAADMLARLEERDKKIAEEKATRRSFYSEGDEDADLPFGARSKGGIHAVIDRKAVTDRDREIHRFNDELYLCSQLLGKHPTQLAHFKGFEQSRALSDLRKALDTATAGQGLEWVPTGFSSTLFEDIMLELKLSGLHPHYNMRYGTEKPPTLAFSMTAYYQPESTVDEPGKIPASDLTTGQFTLTAKKLACRAPWSTELDEDAILAIAPQIQKAIAYAIANGFENCAINGDTTAPHQDTDVTSATDQRKMWKGYRKLALAAAKSDLSTFNSAGLVGLRKKMGKYGANSEDLFIVCSVNVAMDMLSTTNFPEVQTLEKYGPNAAVLKGEVGKWYNIPIIVSENYRTDLNAAGTYDGVTVTKTGLAMVNRRTTVIGDRRKVTVKVKEDIETDQNIMVATARMDLQSYLDTSTKTIVAVGYNIAS